MSRKAEGSTREIWRERVRRQARGGLSVAEFCRREGVSQPSFYQWRKRLHDESASQSPAEFVSVDLPSSILGSGIQIEVPGGVVVRLPHDVSTEIVEAAIEAACRQNSVQEVSPC